MLTWGDYYMSQTCMNQSTMRGNSMWFSQLCSTWLDEVHGPMDSKYPTLQIQGAHVIGPRAQEGRPMPSNLSFGRQITGRVLLNSDAASLPRRCLT
jgi:hypothetical protein